MHDLSDGLSASRPRAVGATASPVPPRPSPEGRPEPAPPPTLRPTTVDALVVLGSLVLAKAGFYAWRGAGFFLDDWRLVSHTQAYGVWGTLHDEGSAVGRPVAWLVFNLVYAMTGTSPGRLLVVMTLLNVVAAVLVFVLLARFVAPRVSLAVAVVWLLLPTHTSLTIWGSTVQALFALVLVLGGTLLLNRGRWALCALCFVTATLCYQVVIPVALLACVVCPGPPSLRRADRARVAASVGLALLWVSLHPTYPPELQVPDVPSLWMAHFGTGLLASDAPPAWFRLGLAVGVLVGAVICLVAFARGRRGADEGPGLVVVGLGVWVLGLVVLVSTPQWVQAGEFGITDRVFGVSTLGSALVLTGIGLYAWRRVPVAAVLGAAVLMLVCVTGQQVALTSWSQAGADARALLDHLGAVAENPNRTTFLVGPGYPVRNNVRSLEADSAYFAHKLAYPPGNSGTLAFFDDPYLPLPVGSVVVLWADVDTDLPDRFYEPIARVDPVAAVGGRLLVAGWALDRSSRAPVAVEVFLDDGPDPVATVDRADLPRPDIGAWFGQGAHHGFSIALEGELPGAGTHRVCIRGVGSRVAPTASSARECVDVVIAGGPDGASGTSGAPAAPGLGQIDVATPVASGLHVSGWAMDGRTASPVPVAVLVDDSRQPYGAVLEAGGSRPDLEFRGFGGDHGFDEELQGPMLAAGDHQVCLWAWPGETAADGTVLHCVTVAVPAAGGASP